jgi:hypothetical protein
MIDIDAALVRLRNLPAPPALANIDEAILAGVADRSTADRAFSNAVIGLAAMASLAMGLASSLLPLVPASAADVTTLGTPLALAPSTLLRAGK